MLLLLLPPSIMPESEFNRLKQRRQELQNHLSVIQQELSESETFFETQLPSHDYSLQTHESFFSTPHEYSLSLFLFILI
jgi:hypothetical protein